MLDVLIEQLYSHYDCSFIYLREKFEKMPHNILSRIAARMALYISTQKYSPDLNQLIEEEDFQDKNFKPF